MLKNKKWLGIILSIILLIFSINGFTAYYKYTQESGTDFYVGTGDKADALEDTNEMRQIIDDLGALLFHSKRDGVYPEGGDFGGTIQIPETGLKFGNDPVNDDIAAYIAGEMTWQTKTELGIDLSLYYLKTEIDSQTEVEAIWEVTLPIVTGSFTVGNLMEYDSAEVVTIKDAGIVAIDVVDAVTKKHAQNTDTDLDADFEATFAKKADKLSVFATTSSAELAGVISDETGTELLVYGTSPNITTPTGIVKGDVGLGNVENLKVKLDGTAAPGVSNDNTEGYAVGSRWIDITNDKEYVALDVSTGAAVWTETTEAGAGAGTYLELTDTPAAYDTGKYARSTADGVIWDTPAGAGDMTKAVYDTDTDNIVDKAETVDDGVGNSSTAADVKDAVTKKHAQNTDTDLDATFEATFVKKADTVNVLSDITSAGADIEDAVTKKHTQNTDTAAGGEWNFGAHSAGFTIQTDTGTGEKTIDWTLGNYAKFTFGAGNVTFAFDPPTKPSHLTLIIIQDGIGGRDCTLPVKWLGAEPTWIDGGAGKGIVVAMVYDGTSYWSQGTPWEE